MTPAITMGHLSFYLFFFNCAIIFCDVSCCTKHTNKKRRVTKKYKKMVKQTPHQVPKLRTCFILWAYKMTKDTNGKNGDYVERAEMKTLMIALRYEKKTIISVLLISFTLFSEILLFFWKTFESPLFGKTIFFF